MITPETKLSIIEHATMSTMFTWMSNRKLVKHHKMGIFFDWGWVAVVKQVMWQVYTIWHL